MQKLEYNSKYKTELIDITNDIKEVVIKSGIKNGIVTIFVPHSTCSIFVAENQDPNLKRDILSILHSLIPNNKEYYHKGGNADAHLKSAIVGTNITLIVENATLVIGRWQGIFLSDFDGPRKREVNIKVISTS
jgi:secondary thiamine-phosphate synthase enzyme